MSLADGLAALGAKGTPVRVGVVGAGKFASMFLAQAPRTPGLHVVAVADLNVERARASLARVGWAPERSSARSPSDATATGGTFLTDDATRMIRECELDVIVEATGNPAAGIRHCLLAFAHGRHVVMVNVEADALAGPYLARRAVEAGVIYSFAYGDQPALIAELVDWARTAGFDIVAAGKGTKYLPGYHQSTPDTVWGYYGFTPEQVSGGDFNAKMFNSFLDGTKSALEMAAVANATGLAPPDNGLSFPPCGADDLATVLRPEADGGVLAQKGMVEVVSSVDRNGNPVLRDLRWGVYVTFDAPTDYVRDCFAQYGLRTDPTGRYAAMYKPYHLIGLELGVSIASIAVRGEATGSTRDFSGDVVATAKRDLAAGEVLDGEGGYMVYGMLLPAKRSLAGGHLPIGLAHGFRLAKPVKAGQHVHWSDVVVDDSEAVRVRKAMEEEFR